MMADNLISGPVTAVVAVAPAAVALSVPLPIILGAIIGAAYAASNSGKIEPTIRSFFTTLIAFGVALLLGVFLGAIGDHLFAKYVVLIEFGWVGGFISLVSSALSQSVILPGIADRLGVEIKNRSV